MDRPTLTPCVDHGYKGDAFGYSQMRLKAAGKWLNRHRHRVVYAAAHGLDVLTMGGVVMHLCDNPRCVNVGHLRLATQLDNVEDMRRKGRASRGTGRPSSKLNEEQVLQIREAVGTQSAIAARFGIAQAQVSRIKGGKQWAALDTEGNWIGRL